MRIFILTFLLFLSNVGKSQVKINGKIRDKENKPINAATVQVFNNEQKEATTITNEKGFFLISAVKKGVAYKIEIVAIGYEKKTIALTLDKDTVLSIQLLPLDNNLKEVKIIGGKKMINITPDKTVVNLSSNRALIGSNIADALRKIPGVQMSNGVISFAGKGQVKLMQDGRLLQLSEKELTNYLKTIPVNNLEKVELISHPSAAYEADGNAGIINLISKKSGNVGYSGSIEAGYKQWQEYPGMNLSANISHNSKKWNLYANANMFRIRHKYGFRWEEYYPDRSWIMSDTGDYKQNSLAFNAGAEYKLTDKSVLGINAGYSRYYEGGADYVRNTFYNASKKPDSVLTTYATYVPLAKTQTYDLYYKTQLDTVGTTFSLDGNYLWFYRTDECYFTGKTFLADGSPLPASTAKFYNNTLQKIDIYALKADINMPTHFANFQFGSKINFIKTYNDLNYYRLINEEKIVDNEYSNEYQYKENTQAFYVNADKTMGNWAFNIGLRGELTQTKGYNFLSSEQNNNDYFRLFPNVMVSYKKGENSTLDLTYNKRIRRPSFWNLNPYKSLLTAHSYYEGNPFLKPEYSNNIQLQHTWKNQFKTAVFAIFTKDGFDEVTFANVDTNFVYRKNTNFANSSRFGVSEDVLITPFHCWATNESASVYYTNGHSLLSNIKSQSGWGAYVVSNNNFYFDKQHAFSASLNVWYHFPEVLLVNKYDAYYNVDFGLQASILKNKLSVNAAISDIFGTSAPAYTSVVNNIRQKYSILQLNRQFNLTMVFKFGNAGNKQIEHVGGLEDAKERM